MTDVNKESVRIQDEMKSGKKSRLALYSDLIVGQRGIFALIKYELITLLCFSVPGAFGLVLRKTFYPRLLKKCGHNVIFGTRVVLRHPNKIEIGNDVIIDDNCLLDAKGSENNGIVIGNGVFVGRNSILSCKNGDITLGENVNIGFNSEVFSGSKVTLGDNVLVAAYCYVIGGDHDSEDAGVSVAEQGRTSRGISIGSGSWLGAGVKILDGVKVGSDTILGAGAVVTKDVPDSVISAGVPAKVIRKRAAK